MKTFSASLLAILLAGTVSPGLHAQQPASPFGLTPAKPDTLLPEGQGGLPLMPDSMPAPGRPQVTPEKQSKTSAAEDALRDLIKLRVAKTKAQSDPALQALWDTTYKARTDYEQREILTQYYTQLCAKIAKIDKTIKPEVIEALRDQYVHNYDQSRIAPTVPPTGRGTR